MLDILDTAVIELDGDNRIRSMNGAAEECFATGRERATGLALGAINHVPDDLQKAVTATRDDKLRRHLCECRLAGGLYDCNIQSLPGERVLLELYQMQWEQQRRQLRQREVQTGMLDLLRRQLGHELRNPLGGIRGAAQMLAEELGDEELGTLARLIMREVDRIDELIQRFGQTRLQASQADIHQVIDEAIELLEAEAGDALAIGRDFDPSIPTLPGDATALRQVMLNLLRNAFEADARTILLRTRIELGASLLQPGQTTQFRLDVEDDGAGVPENLRPLLFLPLVTGRRDGTGLGLALSQQIAAAHGGLLFFEPLDHGSRFSLRLPMNGHTGGQAGDARND